MKVKRNIKKMKKNSKSKKENKFVSNLLVRVLIVILSGIIFHIWTYIIFAVFVIQLIIFIIKQEANQDLKKFSEIWIKSITNYFRYALFISNERPFPFNNIIYEEK